MAAGSPVKRIATAPQKQVPTISFISLIGSSLCRRQQSRVRANRFGQRVVQRTAREGAEMAAGLFLAEAPGLGVELLARELVVADGVERLVHERAPTAGQPDQLATGSLTFDSEPG